MSGALFPDTKVVLVVAPHADDETLGVGGTLLRLIAAGCEVHWLLMSDVWSGPVFSQEKVDSRNREIQKVAGAYGIAQVHRLGYKAACLETFDRSEMISKIGRIVSTINADTMFLPHPGDAHSDHRVSFDAAAAAAKWFRYPSLKSILSYETVSETGFGLGVDAGFEPTIRVDISPYLKRKLEIMALYEGEMGEFPFPRSVEAITALARLRGAECGCQAAESFHLYLSTV